MMSVKRWCWACGSGIAVAAALLGGTAQAGDATKRKVSKSRLLDGDVRLVFGRGQTIKGRPWAKTAYLHVGHIDVPTKIGCLIKMRSARKLTINEFFGPGLLPSGVKRTHTFNGWKLIEFTVVPNPSTTYVYELLVGGPEGIEARFSTCTVTPLGA